MRFLVFDLLPLSAREAAEIVELATEAEPLRPHEVEELARRSGGSPLFLIELSNGARSTGTPRGAAGSVEAVITADIDRLAPSDRIVLRYASVLGVTFDQRSAATRRCRTRSSLDERLWGRLKGLVDRDADGRLRFRNTLVHDAAYEGLPFRRRRELHGSVGRRSRVAWPTTGRGGRRALRCTSSRREISGGAWRYSRHRRRPREAVYANVEAASFYERALRRPGGIAAPREPRRRRRGGGARRRALPARRVRGGRRRVQGLAVAPARGPGGRGPAHAQARPRSRWRLGRYPQALRWLTRGIRVLDEHDEPSAVSQRASLDARTAVIRQMQGHSSEAIDWCRRTIELAEASGAREALAQAFYVLDWAYATLGRFDDAVYAARALSIYEELGNPRASGATLTTSASSRTAGVAGASRSTSTSGPSRSGRRRATAGRPRSPSSTGPRSSSIRDGWPRPSP